MNFKEQGEALGLEEDEFLELVELFIETGNSDLNKLQSAFSEKDIQSVVETAHSIKGSSGNLGFMDIYETARGIEANARNNSMEGADGALRSIKEIFDLIGKAYEEGKR